MSRKNQKNNSEKIIQMIAAAVLVVMVFAVIVAVVVVFAVPYIKQLTAAQPVPTEVEEEVEEPVFSSDEMSASGICAAFDSISASAQYSEPPMKIDKTKQYFANVKMAKGGEFVIQLYPDKAPITVNSFVFLACKGYFNGVTFHRVLEGFMAQGGDPTGSGSGGPGYEFVNEDSDLTFDKAGVVAMANAGRDTNGSQFFITFDAAEFLNGGYTIFGQVVEGMDVVNGITRRDPQMMPNFEGDAMESVTITEK